MTERRLEDHRRLLRAVDVMESSRTMLQRATKLERWGTCTVERLPKSARDIEMEERCAAVGSSIARLIDDDTARRARAFD